MLLFKGANNIHRIVMFNCVLVTRTDSRKTMHNVLVSHENRFLVPTVVRIIAYFLAAIMSIAM